MSSWLDHLHPSLKPLWDMENALRRAARNAIFLRNGEAKQHLDEARRHYKSALSAFKGAPQDNSAAPPAGRLPPPRPPGSASLPDNNG